jgi:osmotically-inducible protein OsmY
MDTIFQEMLHSPDPTLMKKIGVQVQNGRVILTGRCKPAEREKEVIAFIEKIAGPGTVENRLETHKKK